jgi:hypothetical protein
MIIERALDKHDARALAADRATELSAKRKLARQTLEDINYICEHGIGGDRVLYRQIGGSGFLALVWLQERPAGLTG